MTKRNVREKKIEANMSKYLKWESRQNDRMARTIDDIKAVFEVMDYRVSKKVGKKHAGNVDGSKLNMEEKGRVCTEETFEKTQLRKLVDVFDFKHYEKDNSSVISPIRSNYTVGSDDNFYVHHDVRYDQVITEEPNFSSLEQVDKFEKCGIKESAIFEGNTKFLDVDRSRGINLLGIPPPIDILPSIRYQDSEVVDLRHSKEAQLLLHDLISGDICDV